MEVFWARTGKSNGNGLFFRGIHVGVLRSWSREWSGTRTRRAASSQDKKSAGMLHLTLARVT